jgi:hypothetical protein
MTKQKEKEKRIAVAAWLDGAKSHLDQLDAKAEREAYPESGRWLLSRQQVKSWLDFRSTGKPLLWIRGIPGAGKVFAYSDFYAAPLSYIHDLFPSFHLASFVTLPAISTSHSLLFIMNFVGQN